MPKSRRDKVVALTQTKRKGREWKGGLIESVREALDEYSSVFVFRCHNQRNNTFKELKKALDDSSRFFMGSNKVLQVALGKGPEDEQRDGLHQLSQYVKGHTGLVFTNLTKEDLEAACEQHRAADYARTGTVATATVVIDKGPVHGPHGGLMEHTMEPTLRKNGMPTKLNRGVIELLADHTVCKEGEFISPAGAILLRIFGHELSEFKIDLVCGWVRRRRPSHASLSSYDAGSFIFVFVPLFLARATRSHFGVFGPARASRLAKDVSAVTTNRCGWLRRLATGLAQEQTLLTKSAIHFRSRNTTATHRPTEKTRYPFNTLSTPTLTAVSVMFCGPLARMGDGKFETYAAAEEDDGALDLGDVERDRFRYDHVPDSMMLPKELMDAPAGEPAGEKPKKRTSARKKAGTKL